MNLLKSTVRQWIMPGNRRKLGPVQTRIKWLVTMSY